MRAYFIVIFTKMRCCETVIFLKEDKVIVFYHINVSLCQEYRKFSGILGGTT